MVSAYQSHRGERLAKALTVLFKARMYKYERKYMGPHGWVYVYSHARGHEVHQHAIPIPGMRGDRGWSDYAKRDGRVLAALRRAHGVPEVEAIIRHVRHREFAVGIDAMNQVVAVSAGPMIDRSSVDHPHVIAARVRAQVHLPRADGITTVILSHNHPAGTPPSEQDMLVGFEAAPTGLEHLRVASWYGSWDVTTSGMSDPGLGAAAISAALEVAWVRTIGAADGLTHDEAVGIIQAQGLGVAHRVANGSVKEISRIAQDTSERRELRGACKLAAERIRFEPARDRRGGEG